MYLFRVIKINLSRVHHLGFFFALTINMYLIDLVVIVLKSYFLLMLACKGAMASAGPSVINSKST